MKDTAILLPSFNKPELCFKSVESILQSTDKVDIFVSAWLHDPELSRYKSLLGKYLEVREMREYGPALNDLWKKHSRYKYYVLWSDDVFAVNKDWLDILVKNVSDDGFSLLWSDDGLNSPHRPSKLLARVPFITGKVADVLGYVSLPGLAHYYLDDVITRLSAGLGRYGYVPESVVKHLHQPSPQPENQMVIDEIIYKNWNYDGDLLNLNRAIHLASVQPQPKHIITIADKNQEAEDIARARRLNLKLSIICPTAGRSTLETAVNSVIHQLNEGDEIIVVGDRKPDIDSPFIRYIHYSSGGLIPGTQISVHAPTGFQHDAGGITAGLAERDIGQAAARGDYILHVDDDDIWMDGMIDVVRTKLTLRDPREWHLFRMQYGCKRQWISTQYSGVEDDNYILPKLGGHDWRKAQYGCQWIVLPNQGWLPRWRIFKGTKDWSQPTDWTYIARYMANVCYEPIYHNEIVGIIRPTMQQIKDNLPETMWPKTLQYAPQPRMEWNGDPAEPVK